MKPEEEIKEVLNLKINSERQRKFTLEAKLDIQEIVNKVIKWEKHYIKTIHLSIVLKKLKNTLGPTFFIKFVSDSLK